MFVQLKQKLGVKFARGQQESVDLKVTGQAIQNQKRHEVKEKKKLLQLHLLKHNLHKYEERIYCVKFQKQQQHIYIYIAFNHKFKNKKNANKIKQTKKK